MKNKSKTLFSMLAAGAFALTSLTAHANTITLQFVSVVPDGFGAFNWTYTYALENSVLMPGDYFNLLDFGPATVVVPPTGPLPAWVYTQPATGPIPASIIPQNGGDTAVVNAVFTWTDGIAVVGSSVPGMAYTFILKSSGGTAEIHDYVSKDHALSPTDPSTGAYLESDARGPIASPIRSVPDGGTTVMLLGVALSSLGLLRKKFAA